MNVISLFSGCGGLDVGFEGGFSCFKKSINEKMHPDWIEKDLGDQVILKKTGFDVVFANDIRRDAKAAWCSYFSKKHDNTEEIYKLESIVDIVKKAQEDPSIFPKDVDVITGGFPCQDFSVAGKRLGFNSDKSHNGGKLAVDEPSIENRGHLYMWMREIISIVKPKMFIAENVKGLVSLENIKEIIESDFSQAANGGYLIVPTKVIQAANYGVPQSRERVIFYGFKKSALTQEALEELSKTPIKLEYDPYPIPTHLYRLNDTNPLLCPYVSCADVLLDLDEPDKAKDQSQQKYSKAKFVDNSQGNVEIKLDSVSPTIRSEHHGNIEYRRLSIEHGGKNILKERPDLPERRLTIRECARLQTFPDDYEFILPPTNPNGPVCASDAYKLIGNAVPCILGYNIAMRLKENWNLYFKQ